MSLVDSLDSVLMLYAYAPLRRDSPDGKLALFWESKAPLPREPRELLADTEPLGLAMAGNSSSPVLLADMTNEGDADPRDKDPLSDQAKIPTGSALHDPAETGASGPEAPETVDEPITGDYRARRMLDAKASTMSTLSITLTVLSILVALR
jgi:high-affinity nickel-transport protein